MRQAGLSEVFQETKRRELDKAWARFFYEANIPFIVSKNKAFKESVKRTSKFCRGIYVHPSYHDLQRKFLVQAKEELQTHLQVKMVESIRKFGATLAVDRWSSVTNYPYFNAMLVSPAIEQFLGVVDTTGYITEYQASTMEKYIEEVGPQNIVQICTDNASSMKAAADIITDKYPHIYFQGCAVHAMNLLLEDWRKATCMKEVVKKSRTIIKFIKRRHMPLAIFRKHEEKLSLLMSGKTRFGSNFLMVDRLLQVRTALEQSIVDPQWAGYVSKLRDSRTVRARTISKKVKEYVLNEHFWKRCTNFREVVAPMMWALHNFDGKGPCMGKILHIFRKLEKHVVSLRGELFRLDHDMADPMEDAFYNCWTMVLTMKTDLHYAGALLNPYLLHDKELADDSDSLIAYKRVLQKLCSLEMYPDVVQDFLAFRHKQGLFHDMFDPKDQKCLAHDWWAFEGACGKLIAPIARRILGQAVSSSSCERNWSSYSFVHNKSRNRLQPKWVEDLVYVYTHSRLMAKGKEKDEKKWYVDNVDSEDLDSAPEEEFEDHGDLDSDGMDDGNLGVRGSYG
jgi:hypothetical protein